MAGHAMDAATSANACCTEPCASNQPPAGAADPAAAASDEDHTTTLKDRAAVAQQGPDSANAGLALDALHAEAAVLASAQNAATHP